MVWLVCEDQSLFMPMYGDYHALMPNVQSLAEEGTIFDHFFSVAPVCAPSRSSILTGVQPSTMGTHHMRAYQAKQPKYNTHTGLPIYSAPAPDGVRAFTEHLRLQGVYCTNNAKEDYNFQSPPLAWDESSQEAHWRNRPPGVPFFSVFNFNVSHESQIWKRSDLPCDATVGRDEIPPLLPNCDETRKDLATNYCNLEELDRQVGQILTQLKEDNLYDETTIVFFSDHGGPFPRFKRSLSDAGLRVPLVIKWGDGVPAPSKQTALHSFLDLAPSVLAWFGVPLPSALSGIPITPQGTGWHEIHGASDRFDEVLDRSRTIRTRNWRLTRNDFPEKPAGQDLAYRKNMQTTRLIDSLAALGVEPWRTWKYGTKPAWELYQTSEDPWELVNLCDRESLTDTLNHLKQRLELAFPESQDLGRLNETDMVTMFSEWTEQQPLSPARLEMRDNTIFLLHDDPNVSLGWRATGTQSWSIASSGDSIFPGSGTESIELLTARIGWESLLTHRVLSPSAENCSSYSESVSEVRVPESSTVNEPGS